MALEKSQQITVLAVLATALVALSVYQRVSHEAPRTQPLTYTRGMKVSTPVRRGISASGMVTDPLAVVVERRADTYPGVMRDIFRMSVPDPAGMRKPDGAQTEAIITQPVSTAPAKTAEEVSADLARADLSTLRFLGYLTDEDSSRFLSKEGELFIVKSGDTVLKNYMIKAVGKDHVIMHDMVTKVEVRIELTGSGGKVVRSVNGPIDHRYPGAAALP
ncbi:MAG: hypothetical protein HGA43_02845 [Nitrospirae bacterium]|nr:hypothetical protein [Nitrospirota bacterium]